MQLWVMGRELISRRRAGGQGAPAAPAAADPPPADGDASAAPAPDHTLTVEVLADDAAGRFHLQFGGAHGDDTAAGGGSGEAVLHWVEAAVAGAEAAAQAELEAWQELREAGEGPPHTETAQPAPSVVPPLNIVVMVAGTRGDVQPFIPLGRALKAYGHRVRLASHAVDFVESFGLEFFPLGGDPEVLSQFIVRNRGVIPKPTEVKLALDSTEQVRQVLHATYKACTEPDPGDPQGRPFTAQAIIANPPSYGHIHCAEKLGVPLHMVFTMPWTPTREFACPLASLNYNTGAFKKLSYDLIFDFVWSGMAHMVNSWRIHDLGLQPIRTGNHGGILTDVMRVPFMYIWSTAVVKKPHDWPAWVDVVGYQFLEESSLSAYTPPPELEAFLAAGEPPVYVGFGSLVMDDPVGLTRKVVEAAATAGVRLLGWGGLGEGLEPGAAPAGVMLLDKPCPHDWLFPRCAAVVHHGGAGTTAAGLKAGRPTTIVPVFGDQHFWAAAVERMGLGPAGIPIDRLTAAGLAGALRFMQRPEVQATAAAAAAQINAEDGVQSAVDCFHRHLPLRRMLAGQRVEWPLAQPQPSNIVYETSAGLINFWVRPVKGARRDGIKGAVVGAGKGLLDLNYRPLKGLVLSAEGVLDNLAASRARGRQGGEDGEA